MRIRTVLALLLLLLLPAPAHAGWWWDYFDGLSGPGPFQTDRHAPTIELTFWPGKDAAHFLLDDPAPEKKKWYFGLRAVQLNNDGHLQMFEDKPLDRRHVDLMSVDISAMYRVSPVLDLGVGASILRFSSGSAADPIQFDAFYRVGPVGKMTVTPFGGFTPGNKRLRWLQRVPKFYADVTILKGFTAEDFGNPERSTFSTKAEAKVRAGLFFDVSAIVCAVKGCDPSVRSR